MMLVHKMQETINESKRKAEVWKEDKEMKSEERQSNNRLLQRNLW